LTWTQEGQLPRINYTYEKLVIPQVTLRQKVKPESFSGGLKTTNFGTRPIAKFSIENKKGWFAV